MIDNKETFSLYGNLIKSAVENWGQDSFFETYDYSLRNNLSETLKSKLNFKTKITWNLDSKLIDRGIISGSITYLDENETNKIIHFTILATGAELKEKDYN